MMEQTVMITVTVAILVHLSCDFIHADNRLRAMAPSGLLVPV